MTLTPEIIALLTLDVIFLGLGTLALILSLRIAYRWDYASSTPLQYRLTKQSTLVAVIIKYIFILKLPLFLFFVYTCDKLSSVITGAMCASGVVNSVGFGLDLTLFKLFNLYGFGFWLLLHVEDTSHVRLAYTRLKFILFALLCVPLFAEIVLEIGFFTRLDVSKIVSCCGTLFSAASSSASLSLLFNVDARLWVCLFYFFYMVSLIALGFKSTAGMIVSNTLFLIFALISLIVFFSTYVYELPTHRCPFCLLQKEYYYVGYGLYIMLFTGTFCAVGGGLLALMTHTIPYRYWRLSGLFNTAYVLSISAYPLAYYLKNGVWL